MYGWNVDRFVHRSFYQGDELVHLLTGDNVDSLQLGRVDYATNMLQLGSIQTRVSEQERVRKWRITPPHSGG